ncbi:MAG: nucleotide exchange factor GrpE [Pseudorhodoplanes sp.]|nr:nucleotide exchange factor GrpE [Pseudorhodoplanes sp.]
MTKTRESDTATPEETGASAADPVPAETPDPLAAAQAEAASFKDKLLRTLAEMENLRKRTEREVADARLYGIASFARDILGVADNMRRALEHAGADMREGADPAVTALLEGVDLTERELLKALEKNGVKKIEPLGEKFNPNFHQAMYEVSDPAVPAGHVAQVVQAGYTIGDRVLRPALVGVSKGAAKESPAGNGGQG